MNSTHRFLGSCLLGATLLMTSADAQARRTHDAAAKPLKVFVLAGQSNMQGHAHVRTLEVLGLDPKTAPWLDEILDDRGQPRVYDDVWISSIGCAPEEQKGPLSTGFGASQRGPKIGPELTFGITMHELLDEPILIVKTSWGGKSLHTDFRPPSAGPYVFREDQLKRFEQKGQDIAKVEQDKQAATGAFYRLMIEHVNAVLEDPGRVVPSYRKEQGVALAGFVWFQGWNDMVDQGQYPERGKPGGYDDYTRLLTLFIEDVRKDLATPELPFVIGVMGVGGEFDKTPPARHTPVHRNFREAMAAPATLPKLRANVRAVETARFWDHELSALRARDGELRKDLDKAKKQGELDAAAYNAEVAKRRAAAFTPRDLTLLEKGASNAEYHYLGSAKIMAGIGKGFAEAMFEMIGRH